MIGSTIPNQGNATPWKLLKQVFEKGNRTLRIPSFTGLDETLLSVEIDCPKVRLLAPLIHDGNCNTLICFAPHIAA